MSFLAYLSTDQQKKLLALAGGLADTFAKRAAIDEWAGLHNSPMDDTTLTSLAKMHLQNRTLFVERKDKGRRICLCRPSCRISYTR